MNRKMFTLCLAIVIAALGVFALGAFWEREPEGDLSSPPIFPARSSAQLSTVIEDVLTRANVTFTSSDSPQEYSHSSGQEQKIRWIKHEYEASLEERATLSPMIRHLSEAMTTHGGEIFQTYVDPGEGQARLVIGVGTFITHHLVFTWPPPSVIEEALPVPTETSAAQFRAAIVIDDLGSNLFTVQRLLDLEEDLTFSVLPHLEKSVEVARLVHEQQREVFLHLPMEPLRYPEYRPGEGAVMTNMGSEQIRATIDRDLQTVPFASGVNNHMGSRLTADRNTMQVVLEHLHNRRLGFMDSRTTGDSIAYTLAQQLGVKSAQRKVFLDNDATVPAVKAQLEKLAVLAEQGGPPAIAIGHPKEATLQALQEMLPEFERRNIRIVRASTFMQ
ncbi:hypothetical protein CSA56_13415 [candidate division KSB3 bacterium]|uniref:Divergent polysaccharide deacetylase family protein n=1 Tax=candidate division KSB3 bacterium TaxID=2044937 RepID=A0A2G6KBN5_9BACT|nr:MAG: hypothetical protein CSA56_13415 [candidate division KSB3 bacterium]